jgi:hypothetical protein
MESNHKQSAANRFDAASAVYGPTDAAKWAAFSLGGNVNESLDRGLAWDETDYGRLRRKAIEPQTEPQTELLSDADKQLLVQYRADSLMASDYDFDADDSKDAGDGNVGSLGDDTLNCVELVARIRADRAARERDERDEQAAKLAEQAEQPRVNPYAEWLKVHAANK